LKTSEVSLRALRYAVAIALIVSFSGTAQSQPVKKAASQCGSIFGVKVCTAYRMQAGRVTEFSLRVPIAAIEKAPANSPRVWPPKADVIVPFAPAVQKQTGFTFANIYWNPHGHPPAPYMVPHFDFHFYFAPERKVLAITCKDTRKPRVIPAGYEMPNDYIPHVGKLIGMCIPAMGMHAAPVSDFHGKTPWRGSLIAGYYAGQPLFMEPMITRALLLKKHSFSLPVPDITATPHVRYPKRFRAVYEAKSQAYKFTFFY
jgi:hypothetical protein